MQAPLPAAAAGGETHMLDQLWQTIAARRGADPGSSYTASLLARHPAKPAQKLAEEAAECAIEAIRKDPAALVKESADLLFHLLVLLAGADVAPEEVYRELIARERASSLLGSRRKARSRKPARQIRQLGTTKIP